MAGSRKDTKRVIKALSEWNKARFTEAEAFGKVSLKLNRKKLQEFAALFTDGVLRPLTDKLGEHSDKPLVAMVTGRDKLGKMLFLAQSAQQEIAALETAADNEELFLVQKRLREICSAVVDEGLGIMHMEGTPFAQK